MWWNFGFAVLNERLLDVGIGMSGGILT